MLTGLFEVKSTSAAPTVNAHEAPAPRPADGAGRPGSSPSVVLPGLTDVCSAESNHRHYYDGVARVGVQAAEALAHSHAQGILHRDVKPSNLLLDTHGTVWVTDFGLAKSADGENLTHTGELIGTLRYLAPECFQGRTDACSDQYALGLTLYELLTLRPAFDEGDRNKLIAQVMHDEPPRPRKLRPEVPRDLETIVLKAMDRDPAGRYPALGELAKDLQRFLAGEPIKARRVGPGERLWRWGRRNPALAAAIALAATALLAVSAVSALWALREGTHAANLQAALDETKYRRAENHLDHGLELCNRDDVGVGLLWLARALDTAPASAEDLKSVVRAQIGGWAPRLIPLKACLHSPEPVTAAALSPDGRTVWAAGQDKRLRRWDVTSRELLGPPTRLPANLTAIAWGPAGKVLTICDDGAAQLWDAERGSPVGVPLPHKVLSAAWDHAGRYLVTGDHSGNVRFWDADGGNSARPGFRQKDAVRVLTVSPDGKTVLTGDGTDARLWNTDGGRTAGDAIRHEGKVHAATFSPDSRTVLTSSGLSRTTRLWEVATGKPVSDPLRHKGIVEALAFSPDGRAFVTGGQDRMARVWSVRTNEAVGQALHHETQVGTVALSGDGRTLLTVDSGNTLRVWEIGLDRSLGLVLPHGRVVGAAGFLPQGGAAFTAGGVAVRFWDPATGAAVGEPLTTSNEHIKGITWSHDGRRVLVQCLSPTAWLWDRESPTRAGTPFRHPKEATRVISAALSPDGGIALTGCFDGSVRFWDPVTALPRGEDLDHHKGLVHAAAFSPDGKTAATGGEDGQVWLWDVASRKALGQPLLHGGPVLSLAFSPGGEKLLTASTDHRARLWVVSSGALLQSELRHTGTVRVGAFSPDGHTILTGSEDGTARLWDAANGKPLGEPLAHYDRVIAAAFSPDGKAVVTGSMDGTARLWDVATGKSLGPPLAHAPSVWAAAFSPDGKTVLTGSADGTARLWRVPAPVAEPPGRIARELEALTGLSLDETDTLRLLDAAAWEERRRQSGKAEPLLPPKGAGMAPGHPWGGGPQ